LLSNRTAAGIHFVVAFYLFEEGNAGPFAHLGAFSSGPTVEPINSAKDE
jgi:hypothetical protein